MVVETKYAAETGATAALADFIVSASYASLPEPVRQAAVTHILDSLGNMVGGASIAAGKVILDLFRELGGTPESTVWATGDRTSCPNAAYVNSALTSMLDFDDTSKYPAHIGATVVPPALAMAERVHASGRDLMMAVVVGYEVSQRLGYYVKPSYERRQQLRSMATWQIFGATAACARLLRLSKEQTLWAMGHTGMSAPVASVYKMGLHLEERPFSWLKNNYGWASMGGVLACLLAARNFPGNRRILDGQRGFWVMSGSDQCNWEALTQGLGQSYVITDVSFKPYASCWLTHTTVESLERILASASIEPNHICRIRVLTTSELVERFNLRNPKDIIDAQFSIPPLIGLTLAGHHLSHGLAEAHLYDPEVTRVAAKVEMEVDPEADRLSKETMCWPSTVIVEMDDGRVFKEHETIGRGQRQPLTPDEVKDKFLRLTSPLVGETKARKLASGVEQLPGMADVAKLTGK